MDVFGEWSVVVTFLVYLQVDYTRGAAAGSCVEERLKPITLTRKEKKLTKVEELHETKCGFMGWFTCGTHRSRYAVEYVTRTTTEYRPVRVCCDGYSGKYCAINESDDRVSKRIQTTSIATKPLIKTPYSNSDVSAPVSGESPFRTISQEPTTDDRHQNRDMEKSGGSEIKDHVPLSAHDPVIKGSHKTGGIWAEDYLPKISAGVKGGTVVEGQAAPWFPADPVIRHRPRGGHYDFTTKEPRERESGRTHPQTSHQLVQQLENATKQSPPMSTAVSTLRSSESTTSLLLPSNTTSHSLSSITNITAFPTPLVIFVTRNQTVLLRAGGAPEDRTFQCLVNFRGLAPSLHAWYRYGRRAEEIGGRFQQMNGLTVGEPVHIASLTIRNVTRGDVGLYLCRGVVSQHEVSVYRSLMETDIPDPGVTSEVLIYRSKNNAIIAAMTSFIVLFIASVVIVPIFVYRNRYHIKLLCIYYFSKTEESDGKLYDVFISHDNGSHDVRYFVYKQLLPAIESRDMSAFVMGRDDIPGAVRSNEVWAAIQRSRRTLLVISPEYLQNDWCRFECLAAQQEFMDSKLKIVPIIIGETTKASVLQDKDIRSLLKVFPILDWSSQVIPPKSQLPDNLRRKLLRRLPRKEKSRATE